MCITLDRKRENDWLLTHKNPIPLKAKRVNDMNSGKRKYISFTLIDSENNELKNGSYLHFNYLGVYPISDSSRKSLPMHVRAYATRLRTCVWPIKRKALDWR